MGEVVSINDWYSRKAERMVRRLLAGMSDAQIARVLKEATRAAHRDMQEVGG